MPPVRSRSTKLGRAGPSAAAPAFPYGAHAETSASILFPTFSSPLKGTNGLGDQSSGKGLLNDDSMLMEQSLHIPRTFVALKGRTNDGAKRAAQSAEIDTQGVLEKIQAPIECEKDLARYSVDSDERYDEMNDSELEMLAWATVKARESPRSHPVPDQTASKVTETTAASSSGRNAPRSKAVAPLISMSPNIEVRRKRSPTKNIAKWADEVDTESATQIEAPGFDANTISASLEAGPSDKIENRKSGAESSKGEERTSSRLPRRKTSNVSVSRIPAAEPSTSAPPASLDPIEETSPSSSADENAGTAAKETREERRKRLGLKPRRKSSRLDKGPPPVAPVSPVRMYHITSSPFAPSPLRREIKPSPPSTDASSPASPPSLRSPPKRRLTSLLEFSPSKGKNLPEMATLRIAGSLERSEENDGTGRRKSSGRKSRRLTRNGESSAAASSSSPPDAQDAEASSELLRLLGKSPSPKGKGKAKASTARKSKKVEKDHSSSAPEEEKEDHAEVLPFIATGKERPSKFQELLLASSARVRKSHPVSDDVMADNKEEEERSQQILQQCRDIAASSARNSAAEDHVVEELPSSPCLPTFEPKRCELLSKQAAVDCGAKEPVEEHMPVSEAVEDDPHALVDAAPLAASHSSSARHFNASMDVAAATPVSSGAGDASGQPMEAQGPTTTQRAATRASQPSTASTSGLRPVSVNSSRAASYASPTKASAAKSTSPAKARTLTRTASAEAVRPAPSNSPAKTAKINTKLTTANKECQQKDDAGLQSRMVSSSSAPSQIVAPATAAPMVTRPAVAPSAPVLQRSSKTKTSTATKEREKVVMADAKAAARRQKASPVKRSASASSPAAAAVLASSEPVCTAAVQSTPTGTGDCQAFKAINEFLMRSDAEAEQRTQQQQLSTATKSAPLSSFQTKMTGPMDASKVQQGPLKRSAAEFEEGPQDLQQLTSGASEERITSSRSPELQRQKSKSPYHQNETDVRRSVSTALPALSNASSEAAMTVTADEAPNSVGAKVAEDRADALASAVPQALPPKVSEPAPTTRVRRMPAKLAIAAQEDDTKVPRGYRLTSTGALVAMADPPAPAARKEPVRTSQSQSTSKTRSAPAPPPSLPYAPSTEHMAKLAAASEEAERQRRARADAKAAAVEVPGYLKRRREEIQRQEEEDLQKKIEEIRRKELGKGGPAVKKTATTTTTTTTAKTSRPFQSATSQRQAERAAWEAKRDARDALLEAERAKAREERRKLDEEELKRERERRVPKANPVPEEIYGPRARTVSVTTTATSAARTKGQAQAPTQRSTRPMRR